jgi:hypothetical protein
MKFFFLICLVPLFFSAEISWARPIIRDDGNRATLGGGSDDPNLPPLPLPDATATLFGIYQPWTGVLKNLKTSLDQDKSYVIWINVPSQHPLDLRTSDSFRKWIIATPETEMSISHNMIAWRCRNDNGQMYEAATGMTGESSNQSARMINAGFGLTTFKTIFTDGQLNPVWEVDMYIKSNLKKRGVVFLGFEVDDRDCRNMNNFVLDFVKHPTEPFYRFGTTPDPAKMEGGGCVTFASELLNRAGILQSVIPSFFRHIRFRQDLMGGNIENAPSEIEPPPLPWLNGRSRKLSKLHLFLSRWEVKGRTMQSMQQMDPEKMLYVMKQFAHTYLQQLSPEEKQKEQAAFSATPLGPRVTVGKSLLSPKRYTLINDQFDGMSEVKDLSRKWIRKKQREGFQLRREWTEIGMPAFIFERNR